jgi:hypothetical protein
VNARYDREDDVLTLELSESAIDHAEETDGVIAHFSPEDELVLIEVLDVSDFLSRLTKLTANAPTGEAVQL